MDKEILAGNLINKYDVIILPDDPINEMTGEDDDDGRPGTGGRNSQASVPPEYRTGFGDEGVAALEAFVDAGGKLVTFGRAGALPIEKFDLPVVDVIDGKYGEE